MSREPSYQTEKLFPHGPLKVMLYHFFGKPFWLLGKKISLFQFITFRAAMAGLTAFLVCWWFGPRVIAWLKAKRIGERVEKTDSERLAAMHQGKAGTPTMGGVLILMGWFASLALWGRWDNVYVVLGVATTLALGLVGAFDDLIKLEAIKRKGLTIREKFMLVAVVSGLTGFLLYKAAAYAGRESVDLALYFPFFKKGILQVGWFYFPWVVLLLMSCTHAVNLTDGLDGLAAGCVSFALLALAAVSYAAGHLRFAKYLLVPYVPGAGELAVFCLALAGAALGFLWYNCHPADIFMGDTGALALGGALGFVAVVVHQEFLLLMAGGIFVAEAVSVLLQVASFRLTGRRIFKIAPLHHHFQFLNWPEPRVIVRFWIVAALLALASVATLKLR